MAFDKESYRAGVWVGQILGAVQNGCRSAAGTWPEMAMEEDKEALLQWGEILGLDIVFDDRGITISERQPVKPNLTVVQ